MNRGFTKRPVEKVFDIDRYGMATELNLEQNTKLISIVFALFLN